MGEIAAPFRCSLRARPMREPASWIDRYRATWEHQLDGLSCYLEREADPPLEGGWESCLNRLEAFLGQDAA